MTNDYNQSEQRGEKEPDFRIKGRMPETRKDQA